MMTGTFERWRSARHTSTPRQPGQHEVEQHEVGAGRVERGERVVAVLGHRHLVALLAEQVGQRVRERDLVLNDQDARHAVLSPRTVPASVRPSLGLDHARPVGRRGKGHREGRAAPLLAPDAHPAPVVGADVLDDRQAQAGAAGGARAGGVDPVEALEDALLLGRGDALALVGDGHLDRVLDPAGPDADPGAGLAVVDGVGHQVRDRGGEQLGIPEHPQPVLAGEGELDVARLGRHPHPVDRLGARPTRRRRARARGGCRPPAAGTGRRSPGPAG